MKCCRPLTVLIFATLLFLAACKKNDRICINCPPLPECPVASIVLSNENLPFFFVQRGPGNVPVLLEYHARTPFGSGYIEIMKVKYQGRNLYLTNSVTNDTVLVAKLDECGRPVSSFFTEKQHLPDVPVTSYYAYDAQGRLSTYESFEGELGATEYFYYDSRGNVVQVAGALAFEYTYDYTKPVKKGTVIYAESRMRRMDPFSMLESLGHIDLMPRNLRLTGRSWTGDYQLSSFTYSNHVFSGQRLISYDANGSYAIGWSCDKKPHHK